MGLVIIAIIPPAPPAPPAPAATGAAAPVNVAGIPLIIAEDAASAASPVPVSAAAPPNPPSVELKAASGTSPVAAVAASIAGQKGAQAQANFERELEQKGVLARAKAKQAEAKAVETARLKGALTESQLQTGADKLEKKLKPVESMQQAVGRLDEKLAPYAKGGAKEGEAIGGIGGIGGMRGEGITGTIGDIWRWVDDATTAGQGDSASVSAAVAGVIAPIIRNQAGLAQTMSETKKVIDAYSLQSISNEEQFLEALPYIKEAVNRDLARINANTLDPVKEHYEANMAELGYGNSAFDRLPQQLDFSNREGVNAPTGSTMVAQRLDAAGQPIFNATGTTAPLTATDFNNLTDEQLEEMAANLPE